MELWQLTALELSALLRRREVSAVEALEAVLARADAVGPAVNAFSVRLDDRAREAAGRADATLARGEGGPLTGVPVTAKDSQWLAGVESAYGSLTMQGFVPHQTTVALERLEAAGAVIFAKTAVPEFCYTGICESPVHGRTSNPWDLSRVPGGSSGGAGAAIAAGLGPLSLGGDGGGSIRIPAAFCGIVGVKPSFGAVPREPCSDAWKTLVAIGPMARTVADCRLMLDAVAGPDPRDRFSVPVTGLDATPPAPAELRVIASEDLGFAHLDDDVRRVFRETIARLREAGVTVVEDAPGLPSSVRAWATIAASEARYAEAHQYDEQLDLMTDRAAHFMHFGARVSAEEYIREQWQRDHIHRHYVAMFERSGAELLLTPALGLEAFPHGTTHPMAIGGEEVSPLWMDWAPFLYDANLCGYPAVSLPIGFGDDGLPIGLQVQGLRGRDGLVLAAAETIEAIAGALAWPRLATDDPAPGAFDGVAAIPAF